MKKKLLLFLAVLVIVQVAAFAAVTVRCYNKDSQDHTFSVKIGGSSKEVTFQGSSTTSVTIQGGSDVCEIYAENGWVTVEAGDSIEISNGKIYVK